MGGMEWDPHDVGHCDSGVRQSSQEDMTEGRIRIDQVLKKNGGLTFVESCSYGKSMAGAERIR